MVLPTADCGARRPAGYVNILRAVARAAGVRATGVAGAG
jgi:hypothetical protein